MAELSLKWFTGCSLFKNRYKEYNFQSLIFDFFTIDWEYRLNLQILFIVRKLIKNMTNKNIELELRAVVTGEYFNDLLARFKQESSLISHTKRLSVMYFGKINESSLDIRVRITNGEAEAVIKKGSLHADDRIEISQPIKKRPVYGVCKCIQPIWI